MNKVRTVTIEVEVEVETDTEEDAREMAYEYVVDAGFSASSVRLSNRRIGYNFDPQSVKDHFEGSDLEEHVHGLDEETLSQIQEYVHSNDVLYDIYSELMVNAVFALTNVPDDYYPLI